MEFTVTNQEKYDQAFIETFNVKPELLDDTFVYQCIPEWDSVGHMSMVAALEDAFDIMLETEDIIDFSSYTVGIETMRKYGVDI